MAVEINISQREYNRLHNELAGIPEPPFVKYVVDPFIDYGIGSARFAWNLYWLNWVSPRLTSAAGRVGPLQIPSMPMRYIGRSTVLVFTAALITANVGQRIIPGQPIPIDRQPVPEVTSVIPPVQSTERPRPTIVIPTITPTPAPEYRGRFLIPQGGTATPWIPANAVPQRR